jgi:hypothetical protein
MFGYLSREELRQLDPELMKPVGFAVFSGQTTAQGFRLRFFTPVTAEPKK